jgi:hypothetical protein
METPDREIQDLAAAGRFADAVRLYRHRHGAGLKDAWEAVGRLPGPLSALDPALQQEIDDLIPVGHRIEAIKRLRERTPLGLREAKDAIDQRAAQLGLPPLADAAPANAVIRGLLSQVPFAITVIALLLLLVPARLLPRPRVLDELLPWLFSPLMYWLSARRVLATRRLAGRVLVALGWSRGNWLASLFGAFMIALTGFVVATNGLQSARDVGVEVLGLSGGIYCFLVYGLNPRQIRENGVTGFVRFIAWWEIGAYRWAGEQENTLILQLEWRNSSMRWPVPPHQKASVDQILARHVPGAPVDARAPTDESAGGSRAEGSR